MYEILAKENRKLVLFGSKIAGYTFSHFIEGKAHVPYRYFKNFSGKIIDEDGKILQKNIKYYVRKLDENSDLDVDKQVAILKNDDNFKFFQCSYNKYQHEKLFRKNIKSFKG